MATSQMLVIGIGGHVVRIDPSSGTELWRTRIKRSEFVTVSAAGPVVFAGAGGELFCLEAAGGQVLWHNTLKGLGHGLVAFASADETAGAAAIAARRRAAAVAAAGASG